MSERYRLVDLMGDVAHFAEDEPTMTVVHVVKTARGYRVVQDGRMADGLAFDEMLGQVVDLLHPKLGVTHYRMMTREEIAAEEKRLRERVLERTT